jgi:ADP-heptose:LPS heptosyltransferase
MILRSVLFIELLGGIGDLLIALPAIHALARSHPLAHLTVLTFRPGSSLLQSDPLVHRVIGLERPTGPVAGARLRAWVADLLAREFFDAIISDSRHSGLADLVRQAPAVVRVDNLWRQPPIDRRNEEVFLLNLLAEGLVRPETLDPVPRLYLTPAEQQAAAAWWQGQGLARDRVVVLNPHSGMPVKAWPPDAFVQVARRLRAEGYPCAVIAGEHPQVARALADRSGALLLPPSDLRTLAARLQGTAAVVSADTGPARLAAAVGTPVVALFGPTWAGRYGLPAPSVNLQSPFACPELQPRNFTLQRCWWSGVCRYPEKVNCLEDIAPETVVQAVWRLLTPEKERPA